MGIGLTELLMMLVFFIAFGIPAAIGGLVLWFVVRGITRNRDRDHDHNAER
jgi:hypothetical protein